MSQEMEDDRDKNWSQTGVANELSDRLSQAILDGDEDAFLGTLPETFGAKNWGSWAGLNLEHAIEHGLVRVVAALLEAGCPADDINESGGTPLMKAAWRGHLEIARMLLEAGADPDVLVEDHSDGDPEILGQCALLFALYKGHGDLVDLLEPITRPIVRLLAYEGLERRQRDDAQDEAENGPRLSEATVRLFKSTQTPNVEELRTAIADGADVNAQLPPEASNRILGSSPLSFAAGRGRPDLIDLLLEAGADPGLTDHLGCTAANFATLNGHHEIARSLGGPPMRDGEGRA